jgi:hypothetical protein
MKEAAFRKIEESGGVSFLVNYHTTFAFRRKMTASGHYQSCMFEPGQQLIITYWGKIGTPSISCELDTRYVKAESVAELLGQIPIQHAAMMRTPCHQSSRAALHIVATLILLTLNNSHKNQIQKIQKLLTIIYSPFQ